MASSNDTFSNRPFEHLGRLLKPKAENPLPAGTPSKTSRSVSDQMSVEVKSDRQLFLDAVRDVTPIQKRNRTISSNRPRTRKKASPHADDQALYRRLKKLVTSGEGFVISQTPEYMEGTGHHVPPAVTQYLHEGRFSIQDHIDLHGLDTPGALEALERFLRRAVTDGLRSVLVIHGRGLSSPGEPVLKSRLRQLLLSNRWRKWILAFSSARSCDGGTGATYVLLRKKPLAKKKREKSRSQESGVRSQNNESPPA